MAELATGAVTTLLGVIGNEALKLGRVRGDVQFIQEEMESMGSFLANLSGNSHEHDEQVRTWMNQVRMLANDCNSCIDLYLYRGDPTLHLPKKGPGRCLQWAPWLLRKLVAQHRAAGQLRELKNRAQDIGNRRMRYGVEVKTESSSSVAAQLTDTLLLSATQDHEEGKDDVQHGGDSLKVPLSMTSMWMDKEDYFRRRLEEWIGSVVQAGAETEEEAAKKITNLNATGSKSSLPSIAFVVTKEKDVDPFWGKVSEMAKHHFKGVQGKVVPREIKDVGALANEDKAAVPPEIKDAGALANEDKTTVPPQTKDAGAIRTKKKQRPRTPVLLCMKMRRLYHRRQRTPTLLCMKIRRLCHRRPRQPETKDAGALAYQDKPVPPETKDNTNALAQEDKAAVPAETKEAWNFVVVVDVPAVHYNSVPLRPHNILCYILAELERQQRKSSTLRTRWDTYKYTWKKSHEINDKIAEVGVDRTINGIVIPNLGDGKDQLSGLRDILENLLDKNHLITQIGDEALGKLLRLLIYHSTSAVASAKDKKFRCEVAESYDKIIQQTAKILKRKIEEGSSSSELQEKRKIEEGSSSSELQEKRKIEEGGSNPELQEPEYEGILKTVFPETNTNTTAANSPLGTSVDEDVKEMVRCVKEMLHELKELDKPDKNQEADIHTNTEKKEEIIKKIRKQLKIKMMVQKIQNCLESDQRILVILRVDDKHVPIWQETRNSLKALELKCPIVGAMFVVRKTGKQDFPCPDNMQHMEYSLVGVYLDTVVQNTGQHLDFEDTRRILRNILLECEPYEFCMKIFAHALYTKPKRSSEELSKLHKTLCDGATQKSLPSMMFKFSYMELPKEYRSCLLYLAIFPQGHTMRRSTLIGRWVAEGLITTKDWSWSSSVIEAEKCFDTLVARCFVCPAGIGATGKVKSCTVDKLVHGFITKIAMKQRILETRLSHHLAHHFSIFSDVRLRRSETIKDFLKKSSQFSKLKVLDLEGCDCFPQNQHSLSHICMRILMLKYLSLRGTGVTSLPSEIHNLLELEVLDIRETKIPTHATRNILLPKLKRLLAGHVGSSPSGQAKPKNCLKNLLSGPVDSSSADFSSVQIPEKIEKMVGVEILSNVKPKKKRDLRDIASLNELKKLGVVINKESHLQILVGAIFDLLNQSLRFLSITVDITIYKDSPPYLLPKQEFPDVLERLSINESTSTKKGQLLKILAGNGNQLAKVTLTGTFLSQEDLKILANLENLHCVKLRHNKYDERKLTFNTGQFKNLKEFLVEGNSMTNKFLAEGNNMTEIKFDNGAASNLEKIVLSSTDIVSISGVNCLQKLEEIELKGINDKEMVHSLFDNANHIAKVTLRDTMLEQGDLKILAGNKKMRYLVLLGKFYNGHQLIFKDDFQKLNLLIVDSSESDITEISFTNSSPKLEKIVWSFKEIVSLPGIGKLPELKELELNGGDSLPNKLEEDIKQLKIRLDYKPRAKPKK